MNYIRKISLSHDLLKIIACITMFIDHTGYGLIYLYLKNNMLTIDPGTYVQIDKIYQVTRDIGRIAAPIFALMLVEGFFHTKNIARYIFRLAITAVISEIPFDLALYQQFVYKDHQNVIISLLLGLLAIWGIDIARKIPGLSDVLKAVLTVSITGAALEIAQLIQCDYRWHGVLSIVIIYLLHEVRPLVLLAGAASYSWEKYAPMSFLLMYFYNDEKKPSSRLKAVFYIFYPAHLILIYLIGLALGI